MIFQNSRPDSRSAVHQHVFRMPALLTVPYPDKSAAKLRMFGADRLWTVLCLRISAGRILRSSNRLTVAGETEAAPPEQPRETCGSEYSVWPADIFKSKMLQAPPARTTTPASEAGVFLPRIITGLLLPRPSARLTARAPSAPAFPVFPRD